MENLDTYLSLCAEYYDLDKPHAQQEALDFYQKYAKNSQGPILEPMCGTGNFLIPFIEQGFDIEGFDASPSMLAILETKRAAKGIKPHVWQQFLHDIDGSRQYSLIFIPLSSLSLITDSTQVKLGLQKIYNALLPDGTFVFEVETVHAFSDQLGVWKGSMHTRQDGSMIVGSFLSTPLINTIGTILCRYDLIQNNHIVKTEIEQLRLRLYDKETMIALLKEVGFKHIRPIKPYDQNAALSANDATIIFECIK
jgi:SAM-dependent methyltransferase